MEGFTTGPILLLEIDFPDGARYYAKTSVRFVDRYYEGRILVVSSVRRSLQQNLGLFESSVVDVLLADTDRELINLSSTSQFKGVRARLRLGELRLPLGAYETIFEGTIDDFGADNFAFRIVIRDRISTIPPKPVTGFVDVEDFPNAFPEHKGKPLPICYGTHSVTETEDPNDYRNRGAWPTVFVNVSSSERVFLIAAHAVKEINEVYAFVESKGSQLLTLTTDYVPYTAAPLNGQTMAFIKLTSSGFTKLTDTNGRFGALTCNVAGKESIGDGSGSLLSNPIDVLKDLLANYLGSPEINTAMFDDASTVAHARGYVVQGGYTEEKETEEVIKELCDSFQIRIFPDRNGKIACSIFQPISPLVNGLTVRDQWEIIRGSFQLDFESDVQGAEDTQIINTVDYKYQFHWAREFYRGSGNRESLESIATYGAKKLVLALPWAGDSTTAEDVARRMVQLYENPIANIRVKVPMKGMALEITDIASVTHSDAPNSGYEGRAFELMSHIFNPDNFTVDLTAKDVGSIISRSFFLDDEDLRVLSEGTAQVANGSGSIDLTGDNTTGVQVGDIIRLKNPTNEANRGSFKITGVTDSDTITVANTVWTNESGISYDIIPSWITKTGDQALTGHLCDSSTEAFSNGDEGLVME